MIYKLNCGFLAKHIVYWPGGRESYVCQDHLKDTLEYGKDKGFLLVTARLSFTVYEKCCCSLLKRSPVRDQVERSPTSGVLNVKGKKRVRFS